MTKRKPINQTSTKEKKRPSTRGGKPSKNRGKRPERSSFDPNSPSWIYGLHAAHAAIGNKSRRIDRIVATPNGARDLKLDPSRIETLPPKEIDRLLPDGAVHQGLAVLAAPLPAISLDDRLDVLSDKPKSTLVILDQVTDPHNVGAILRTAAAFGADALITTERHAPPLTGVLAKTACGGAEHVPYIQVPNLARAMEAIADAGYFRLGLAGEAELNLRDRTAMDRTALVLGAEGPGLRRLTREHCDQLVKLPTQEPISSLNVSNAAAVALYELG